MTQPRLMDVPVNPDTLTPRQRSAYEYLRSMGPRTGAEVGRAIGAPNVLWAKTAGLSVLRELHRKGLVRRVGKGGGRWALVEGAARTTPGGEAASAPSASVCPDCGKTHGLGHLCRYDPETAEIPF